MLKINLGAGSNIIPEWDNRDFDVDIRKSLPWPDGTVDAINAEHVQEHTNIQEAWNFLEDCYRALRPNGAIRISVPSIEKIEANCTDAYANFCFTHGFADEPTKKAAVKAIVFCHGHQSTWSAGVLMAYLRAIGFRNVTQVGVKTSANGLENTNGHGKVIGDEFNELETVVVEGVK